MGDFLLELLFLFAEAFFEALFEFALEVAFDFDFTQTPETQAISPTTQATMLAMLLDALHIDSVDWSQTTAEAWSATLCGQISTARAHVAADQLRRGRK